MREKAIQYLDHSELEDEMGSRHLLGAAPSTSPQGQSAAEDGDGS